MNISVVITTFNRYQQCKRAIDSVLSQTFKPFEIIVVEDSSNSGIQDWIKDNNFDIKYIQNKTNVGLAASRNIGMKQATGDWIAFLDDDDSWLNNRLEESVLVYKKCSLIEKIACIQCGNETFDQFGKSIGVYLPLNCGNLKESIIKIGAKTPSSSFLFNTEVLTKVEGFSENLISGIDHDIWMKLAVEEYFNICVKKPLVRIYQEPIQTMMTNTQKRIIGLKQYTTKWKKTYQNWYGIEEGLQKIEDYYANVLSGLVVYHLQTFNFKDAKLVGDSILANYTYKRIGNYKFILYVLLQLLKSCIPLKVKYFIKK